MIAMAMRQTDEINPLQRRDRLFSLREERIPQPRINEQSLSRLRF